jgi:fatty-acyl-CoA synthase
LIRKEDMTGVSEARLIGKALEEAACELPHRKMYIYRGKEITFQEMDTRSDRLAAGLLRLGFAKGDRIGIIGWNQPEWLYAYFAAAKIGVAVVGLNVRYRDTEIEYMLNQSQARGLITLTRTGDLDYVQYFDGFREKIPSVEEFLFMGGEGFPGSHRLEELLEEEGDVEALTEAKAAVRPEDLVMIIYTSGTTGRPKGAALSHRSQLASARAQTVHCRVTPEDSLLIVLPLNHVSGITCMTLSGLLGKATGILIPEVDFDEIVKQTQDHRPTIFGGVPTLYTLLFMKEEFLALDLTQVRLVVSGGSNSDPPLLRQLKEVFPNGTVMNLYGLSEVSGGVVMSPWDSDFEQTVRSIGRPFPGMEVKVKDAEGRELPPGETGELHFRGECVVEGYFRMPEETAAAFDESGWLATGDMGTIDDDGYIVLMGRKKEMYIQGGFNVYPVEVENLLNKHPRVAMAAGIGVPDPVMGEVGRYYVIPQPGQEVTEEELKAYCSEHLADYKVPRQIVFRDALPLTPVGKVMKAKLLEDYLKTGQ